MASMYMVDLNVQSTFSKELHSNQVDSRDRSLTPTLASCIPARLFTVTTGDRMVTHRIIADLPVGLIMFVVHRLFNILLSS